MVGTVPHAAAAVDAEFIYDVRLAVMYPDGLCGTLFHAVEASPAGSFVQLYGTDEFVHVHNRHHLLLHMDVHGDCRSYAQNGVNLHFVRIFFHVGQAHTGAES